MVRKTLSALTDHVLVETAINLDDPERLLPGIAPRQRVIYRCTTCGMEWADYRPESGCPGAPLYSWDPWPEGMFTRKQLAAKRLNPGPLAGVIPYDKSADGDGWLRLYRESEATPKPPLSEKRRAAIDAMQAAAKALRTCQRCGASLYERGELRARLCWTCQCKQDQLDAGKLAYELITGGEFVVVDFETSDLDGKIIEVAVIDARGKTLFDQRLRPGRLIAADAYEVHGIRDEELASCPTFLEVYPDLRAVLLDRRWVAYNAEFEVGRLYYETHESVYWPYFAARPLRHIEVICAMLLAAQWVGEWHSHYGNYRWQKLTHVAALLGVSVDVPAHNARGDCLRTLDVLYGIADWYRKESA